MKNNIEAILLLDETVKLLETRSPNVEKKSTEMQTDIVECEDGGFPTEKEMNLANHMHSSTEYNIKCYYCEDKFITKTDLLNHRKQVHPERLSFVSILVKRDVNMENYAGTAITSQLNCLNTTATYVKGNSE